MAATLTPRLYNSYTDEQIAVGTRFTAKNGKTYVWVKAGAGAALVAGNALQAPVQNTDHDQLVATAAAIGAEQITVTTGSSAVTANQYRGGTAVIDTADSLGEEYIISGHLAAGTTSALILQLERPVRVALTTSSRVTLAPNPFNGVIAFPTTATGAPVGVAVSVIAAGEYGWIGRNGRFGTLIQGTPGVGLAVSVPGSAAGSVAVSSATLHAVGFMAVTGVDGKCFPVDWVLP